MLLRGSGKRFMKSAKSDGVSSARGNQRGVVMQQN